MQKFFNFLKTLVVLIIPLLRTYLQYNVNLFHLYYFVIIIFKYLFSFLKQYFFVLKNKLKNYKLIILAVLLSRSRKKPHHFEFGVGTGSVRELDVEHMQIS
jgi:hypothetical protein